MIFLRDNPLLETSLKVEHTKIRLLGHWGSDPGMSLIYIHLNRLIKKHDLNMIFLAGPGHGAPAILSNTYLEGTYSEIYPDKSEDKEGLKKFFTQFSFPGGIGSHCTPETPGSIHEGGELGYSLSHAYGTVFDNPDLISAVIVGDGEAETGPLATSWHSNKFINPIRDGAVLPILHLNGYKINNPTILARISHGELEDLFKGHGYTPILWKGLTARQCIRQWPPRWNTASTKSDRFKKTRAGLASPNGLVGRWSFSGPPKDGRLLLKLMGAKWRGPGVRTRYQWLR